MQEFAVKSASLNNAKHDLDRIAVSLNRYASQVSSVKSRMSYQIKSKSGIDRTLSAVTTNLSGCSSKMQVMSEKLSYAREHYSSTEVELCGVAGVKIGSASKKGNVSKTDKNNDSQNGIGDFFSGIGKAVRKKASDIKKKVTGAVDSTVTFLYDNKDKIISYGKAVVKGVGGITKIAIGLGSIFASGGLSTPAAVLTCVSGINDLINAGYDIGATYNEDYDKVGSFNAMKDGLSWLGGEAGKAFGNEELGSNIGKGVYYASELYVGVANLKNAWDKVKQLDKVKFADLGKELKDLGNTKVDVWKVLNTDVSQLKLDFLLAKGYYKNITESVKNIDTVVSFMGKAAKVVKNTNKIYSSVSGKDNIINKIFDFYDSSTEYKDYTYGGIKENVDNIVKTYDTITGLYTIRAK